MTIKLAAVLLAAVILAGCRADRREPGPDRPETSGGTRASSHATDSEPGDQRGWFADRAKDTGLQFAHFNGMSGEFYFPEMIPPGVGLIDHDNDGDLDVYLVQGQMLGEGKTLAQALFQPLDRLPLRGRLYRNDLQIHTDGTRTVRFTDVTDQSGIDARGYGMGVTAGDFDNDGCIDLYLTNFGPNQLWRNNCDGTFTDVSRQSGTDDSFWGVSAAFADYDRDGWLDLYVGNYARYDVRTDQKCTNLNGRRDYCTPGVYPPQSDRLYRNQGNGKFVDVTATALRGGPFGPALGVSTADFNDDGWIDIYVANDGMPNLLWTNQRDGTLENTALLSGVAVTADGKPEASMGVDAGDFDNDGDEDLFMTELPVEGSNLYVNDGSGLFEDLSAPSGLGSSSLGYTGFGTAWFDFDNDGWLDILSVNGAIQALEARAGDPFPYGERKLLFRNLRDGRFLDVTSQAGAVFHVPEVSRGAAFGDIDNDGDTDVLVGNLNGRVRLLINNVGNQQHWAGLRLVGEPGQSSGQAGLKTRLYSDTPKSTRASVEAGLQTRLRAPRPSTSSGRPERAEGRDMLGARVQVIRKNGPTLWRRARSDGSYASANDPRVLVGLGGSTEAPRIRVRWPSGRVEEWSAVAIDRWTTLKEGTGH